MTAVSQLRNVREARGWSLETASKQVGVSVAALGSYERGDRTLNISHLPKLAAGYGVTVAELLGEPAPAKRPRIILNLPALATAAKLRPAFGAVQRWADSIRGQRGDWAGQALSIRDDDVDVIGRIIGLNRAATLSWLDSTGMLADGSMRP